IYEKDDAGVARLTLNRPDVLNAVNLQMRAELWSAFQAFRDDPDVQVTTLKIRATPDEVASRTANKVVTSVRGDALYFSRLPIPFDRDGRGGISHWKHVGLYAYRRAVLEAFHSLPPSALEQTEKLEQLRLLENGIPIRVVETEEETIGVDTEEDLRLAEARLAARAQ
ncbi:MAG: enoyl-CoA hydratase-related protein, partial [candidate division NC10 bacterium]